MFIDETAQLKGPASELERTRFKFQPGTDPNQSEWILTNQNGHTRPIREPLTLVTRPIREPLTLVTRPIREPLTLVTRPIREPLTLRLVWPQAAGHHPFSTVPALSLSEPWFLPDVGTVLSVWQSSCEDSLREQRLPAHSRPSADGSCYDAARCQVSQRGEEHTLLSCLLLLSLPRVRVIWGVVNPSEMWAICDGGFTLFSS